MNDARLLIVGREDGIARGWLDHLREAGANISVVTDGASALRHLAMLEPELILLDLQLTGPLDGFDTCRAIRSRSSAVVVMAASKVGTYDEVVALAVGADHFITAETPVEVVCARLRSLVRRVRGAVLVDAVVGAQATQGPSSGTASARPGNGAQARPVNGRPAGRNGHRDGHATNGHAGNGGRTNHNGSAVQMPLAGGMNGHGLDGAAERIVDGDLEIDLVAREVRVSGVEAPLTRIEFDLLTTLARHPRRVFTREQLMSSAWDEPFDGSHVLDAHLSRMRGKISEAGGERVAHAVRGVGYRLRA